jgi:hypothetical protein
LAGVRLRKHELQRSAPVLLASRWEPEEHKNGSVCKAVVSDWAISYRRFWEESFDKLDAVVNQMKKAEVGHGKKHVE